MRHNRINCAILQMNSGPDVAANMATALRLAKEAVAKGANWLCLPEVFTFRGDRSCLLAAAELDTGESISALAAFAKSNGVWILAGSFCEAAQASAKVYNTSILMNDFGDIVAKYRKLHLFDANVDGKAIRESDMYLSGDYPVLGNVMGIPCGLSICYDLRFPELYRHYAKAGAKILTVPSSFTTPTGKAHWEVLLRARAIENHAFVVAPNQCGIGAGQVPTYGNSLIVDPWGQILAQGPEHEEAIVMAELDMARLDDLRDTFPTLDNRRFSVGL